MSFKRVLVVGDMIPLPGFPTTGAGFRTWGIGKGLEARGHEVLFSVPRPYLSQGEAPRDIAELAWTPANALSVIKKANPDIVVFCSWPSVQIQNRLDIPTVLDFQGPHLLEREMQGYRRRWTNIQDKLARIRLADFFTCAGDRQRLYFFGWLLMAGIRLSDDVIASIPTSLSPDLPEHEWREQEPTFIYGGYFLPWQDPYNGLETLLEVMTARQRGRLRFFGGRHPVHAGDIGNIERFDALERQLRKHPQVEMPGVVPFDRLTEEYRRAHVALDVMGPNPERELAFTTRTVHYLWCGLPVIHHHYAELSRYIQEYEAGWVVDPADRTALRQALEEVLACPEEVRRRGENAQRLVRERLTWDRTIEPLDAFCRSPWQRKPLDLVPPHYTGGAVDAMVEKKTLRRLMGEAAYHYRHGGLRILLYYTLGFLQKRLKQTWTEQSERPGDGHP